MTPAADGAAVSRRGFLTRPCRRRQAGGADEARGYWIRVCRWAMACRFEITLAGEDGAFAPAAKAALDEIDQLEDELSVFRATSTISAVNRRAAEQPVVVPRYLIDLLAECQQLHRETDGAFDITSAPLSRCWGFLRRNGQVPDPEAIAASRALVGFDAVHLDRHERAVCFTRAGTELNMGAIGKGYALDRAGSGLRATGVQHALFSAGRSSILAIGGHGDGWQIELVSPQIAARPLAILTLRDAAVGTSGAGVQFFVEDGRRYGHVIDPRTGWPARGVLSVSVVASDATRADALSTAFFVGGIALAERYCATHPDVLALVTPDAGSRRPVAVGGRSGVRLAIC